MWHFLSDSDEDIIVLLSFLFKGLMAQLGSLWIGPVTPKNSVPWNYIYNSYKVRVNSCKIPCCKFYNVSLLQYTW